MVMLPQMKATLTLPEDKIRLQVGLVCPCICVCSSSISHGSTVVIIYLYDVVECTSTGYVVKFCSFHSKYNAFQNDLHRN